MCISLVMALALTADVAAQPPDNTPAPAQVQVIPVPVQVTAPVQSPTYYYVYPQDTYYYWCHYGYTYPAFGFSFGVWPYYRVPLFGDIHYYRSGRHGFWRR